MGKLIDGKKFADALCDKISKEVAKVGFEWENIKAVWSKDKKGKWGYSYIVTKHKMSHKMRRR